MCPAAYGDGLSGSGFETIYLVQEVNTILFSQRGSDGDDMRWYCVSPALPPGAQLRIRAKPEADAEVVAQFIQGRAIAVVDVVETEQVDTPQWLQVQLSLSDNTLQDGYVMETTPDGMHLLSPWEQAGFDGCCLIKDQVSVYSQPDSQLEPVGTLKADTSLSYGMLDRTSDFIKVPHEELDDVWVRQSDVQIVAQKLSHLPKCTLDHSFYVFNPSLPTEARIAIRSFPSPNADTVALLDADGVLEASATSGEWLQVIPTSLTNDQEAWIRRITSAWTLVVPKEEHISDKCAPPINGRQSIKDEESEQAMGTENEMNGGMEMEIKEEFKTTEETDGVALNSGKSGALVNEKESEEVGDDEEVGVAETTDAVAPNTDENDPPVDENGSEEIEAIEKDAAETADNVGRKSDVDDLPPDENGLEDSEAVEEDAKDLLKEQEEISAVEEEEIVDAVASPEKDYAVDNVVTPSVAENGVIDNQKAFLTSEKDAVENPMASPVVQEDVVDDIMTSPADENAIDVDVPSQTPETDAVENAVRSSVEEKDAIDVIEPPPTVEEDGVDDVVTSRTPEDGIDTGKTPEIAKKDTIDNVVTSPVVDEDPVGTTVTPSVAEEDTINEVVPSPTVTEDAIDTIETSSISEEDVVDTVVLSSAGEEDAIDDIVLPPSAEKEVINNIESSPLSEEDALDEADKTDSDPATSFNPSDFEPRVHLNPFAPNDRPNPFAPREERPIQPLNQSFEEIAEQHSFTSAEERPITPMNQSFEEVAEQHSTSPAEERPIAPMNRSFEEVAEDAERVLVDNQSSPTYASMQPPVSIEETPLVQKKQLEVLCEDGMDAYLSSIAARDTVVELVVREEEALLDYLLETVDDVSNTLPRMPVFLDRTLEKTYELMVTDASPTDLLEYLFAQDDPDMYTLVRGYQYPLRSTSKEETTEPMEIPSSATETPTLTTVEEAYATVQEEEVPETIPLATKSPVYVSQNGMTSDSDSDAIEDEDIVSMPDVSDDDTRSEDSLLPVMDLDASIESIDAPPKSITRMQPPRSRQNLSDMRASFASSRSNIPASKPSSGSRLPPPRVSSLRPPKSREELTHGRRLSFGYNRSSVPTRK